MEEAMPDIVHRIGIKAPLSKVYAAVSSAEGVAGWWTKETTGTSRAGGSIDARFRSPAGTEIGRMVFDVTKMVPEEEVHWRFSAGPEEWVGTDVTFQLSRDGDMTLLVFGHRNWREQVEFMAHCSMKWAVFMLSLRQFSETGKGQPSPDDLKIDNWN
jgi:uncharacterized protein YndB with AHSA1/START domain